MNLEVGWKITYVFVGVRGRLCAHAMHVFVHVPLNMASQMHMMYTCGCLCAQTHAHTLLSEYGSSESISTLDSNNKGVEFVPVEQFDQKGVRTHICEVHQSFVLNKLNCKNSREYIMQLPVYHY